MTNQTIDIEVSRFISAAPETVYALISDITQMPRFSPETTETGWLDGATAAAVGARFRGANAIGSVRWATKPVITAADPGRRFAFRVPGGARSTWTYALEAVAGGTQVTESIQTERAVPAIIRLLLRRAGVNDRAAHLREGISTTLTQLAASVVAESSAVTPSPATSR